MLLGLKFVAVEKQVVVKKEAEPMDAGTPRVLKLSKEKEGEKEKEKDKVGFSVCGSLEYAFQKVLEN